MKRRGLNLIVLLSWLVSTSLLPLFTSPAKADDPNWSFISSDLDGDGLPNIVEETGWCNAKGCFTTDPLDADSDDDGLTDGEEKLFDSVPSGPGGPASPGIYVIYDNAFKTKEYYPWQPYGHKMIARADSFTPPRPDDLDVQKGYQSDLGAVVVRRGTTLTVGGPVGQTLQINKSISSLTTLTPQQDPFTGLWTVSIPSNGTVGRYTMVLGSETMKLLVIFQLPTPSGELTQNGIDRFVYDDNFNLKRDQQAVLVGDNRYPPLTGSPYDAQLNNNNFINRGTSYTFATQQYNRYIVDQFVIDTINGKTNQKDAVDALADKVDALTIFRNPRPFFNSWATLNPGINPRQQCSNIAGLLAAFSRASGIAARPVVADWKVSSFDHSTEVWLSGTWRVYRGYNNFEMNSEPDNTKTPSSCVTGGNWPRCGTVKNQARSSWGQNSSYRPWHSGGTGSGASVMVLADDNWTSTGLAYHWPSWITATLTWPDGTEVVGRGTRMNINTNMLKTQHTKYWGAWGWTQEPTNLGSPGWPPAPDEGISGFSVTDNPQTSSSLDYQSTQVQLGNVVNEYGVDTNGNGQYDQLVLEVEVTAAQAGHYWLRGELSATHADPSLIATGGVLAEALTDLDLVAGTQIVKLVFDGIELGTKKVDGPYNLNGLWITDVADPDPSTYIVDSLAFRADAYLTTAYEASAFETYGAVLSGQYSHNQLDSDGNGQADGLVVSTGINVYQPGSYTVEGNLYDVQDNFVSHATWSGTGPDVTLQFKGMAGSTGPYTLRDVNLLNSSSQGIDQNGGSVYTIEPIAELALPQVAGLGTLPAGGGISSLGTTITPTLTYNEAIINGNLQISAGVQVAVAGSYKMEAWLADGDGNLVTWAQGQPTSLSPGPQMLSITFNGKDIRARGIAGPYQVVALKVLNGNASYEVLDKVDEAFTTQPYTLNQFAASGNTLFEDYVENGGSQWTAESPWAIEQATHLYFSPSEAWRAGNANASLTMVTPINLADVDKAAFKFNTSHKFGGGEAGYIEVSTTGNPPWTPMLMLTGSSTWSGQTKFVDLSTYAGQPAVYLRFRLNSAGGSSDGWYVDDMVVSGMPDSDNDGLSDDEENSIGTNPNNPDTDGDGMPDGWEVNQGFNPLVNDAGGDADADGLTNLQEYQRGTNPHNPDSDGDGLPDGWEVRYNFDPLDPTGDNGPAGDPDDDQFTNLEEYLHGTDPRNPDTDGDGIPDGIDPTPGKVVEDTFLPIILK